MASRTRAQAASLTFASIAATALLVTPAAAETLYASTAIRHVGPSEVVGRLYVVDPRTAAAKVVGPIRIPGARSVGITGLAVHPKSRILYGITAGLLADLAPSLVTIDPKTAQATLVGALGAPGSDINFDSSGTLFIWLSDNNQLGTVNLSTGGVTRLDVSGLAGTGGGLAIDRKGRALVAANTAAGTLDTVDMRTGAGTPGPIMTGAPYLSAINSMTFSPEGDLFAVNSNLGSPAKTALVTIDPATGAVALIGELPMDADGLAFSPDATAQSSSVSGVAGVWLLAIALISVLGVAVALFTRGRRSAAVR